MKSASGSRQADSCECGSQRKFHTLSDPARCTHRFHDGYGNRFLLGRMKPAQATVANVVVSDITAGVVKQPSDAIFGDTRCAANGCVGSSQGMVCERPVPGQTIAPQ
jgi:hypothetical protein